MYTAKPAPQPSTGPGRFWYWIAFALVVFGLGSLLVITLLNFNVLRDDTTNTVADSPAGTVHKPFRKGVEYRIYQVSTEPKPSSVSCTLTTKQNQVYNYTLNPSLPTAEIDTDTEGGREYTYVGRFTAKETGPGDLRCTLTGDWFVKRNSDGLVAVLFACDGGCSLLLIGMLILLIVGLLRRRAQRRAERNPWG